MGQEGLQLEHQGERLRTRSWQGLRTQRRDSSGRGAQSGGKAQCKDRSLGRSVAGRGCSRCWGRGGRGESVPAFSQDVRRRRREVRG